MEVELVLHSVFPLVELEVPASALSALHPAHFRCSRKQIGTGRTFVAGPCSWSAGLAVLDAVTHELLVDRELIDDSEYSVRMWIEPPSPKASR